MSGSHIYSSLLALALALALTRPVMAEINLQSNWSYPPTDPQLSVNVFDTVIFSWTSNYPNPVFNLWGPGEDNAGYTSWGHMNVPQNGSYKYSFFDDIASFQSRSLWPVNLHVHLAEDFWANNSDGNNGPGFTVSSKDKLPTTWALHSTITGTTTNPAAAPTLTSALAGDLFLPTTSGLLKTANPSPSAPLRPHSPTIHDSTTSILSTGSSKPNTRPLKTSGGLSQGDSIGIGVAIGVVVLAVIALAIFILMRLRRRKMKDRDRQPLKEIKESDSLPYRLSPQAIAELHGTTVEQRAELSPDSYIREAATESPASEVPDTAVNSISMGSRTSS